MEWIHQKHYIAQHVMSPGETWSVEMANALVMNEFCTLYALLCNFDRTSMVRFKLV